MTKTASSGLLRASAPKSECPCRCVACLFASQPANKHLCPCSPAARPTCFRPASCHAAPQAARHLLCSRQPWKHPRSLQPQPPRRALLMPLPPPLARPIPWHPRCRWCSFSWTNNRKLHLATFNQRYHSFPIERGNLSCRRHRHHRSVCTCPNSQGHHVSAFTTTTSANPLPASVRGAVPASPAGNVGCRAAAAAVDAARRTATREGHLVGKEEAGSMSSTEWCCALTLAWHLWQQQSWMGT